MTDLLTATDLQFRTLKTLPTGAISQIILANYDRVLLVLLPEGVLLVGHVDSHETRKNLQTPEGDVYVYEFESIDLTKEDILITDPQELEDAFWEDFNHRLEDPFLMEVEDGEPLHLQGPEEEFEHILRQAAFADPQWPGSEPHDLYVYAGCDGESARLEEDHVPAEVSESGVFWQVADILLDHFDPQGWSMEYNDGDGARASGYDRSPKSFHCEIPVPSMHERLQARNLLIDWFAQKGRSLPSSLQNHV